MPRLEESSRDECMHGGVKRGVSKIMILRVRQVGAEGESPFTRDAFQLAGFEILHFDVVDDLDARRLGHALGWDAVGGMKLETDLFAWYTIVRRKSDAASPKS